jgi:ABC-type antimicrobial peptide transport system permease subunit
MEKMYFSNFTLPSLMFVINFIIVIVDAIMIYTLFISDIEERTYEFAMLRTLGFQKKSLIILLTVQALFFSLPATLIGFLLLYNFTTSAQIFLYSKLGSTLSVQLTVFTVCLGLFVGIVMPLLSNIISIKAALNQNLREALDRFRQAVDEAEVEQIRMENKPMNFV